MKREGRIIASARIRPDRAQLLKDKAIELSTKNKNIIMEVDVLNWMIDNWAEKIDANEKGLFIKTAEKV